MLQQPIANAIIAGTTYALIALGFTIIYRTVKFFHFAHGVVYTVGAYLAFTFLVIFGVNIVVSFVSSIVLAGAVGVAIDRLVYFPLRKSKASNLVYLIASFGVFIFVQNLLQLVFGPQTVTLRTGFVREGYHVLGAIVTPVQIALFIVSLFLFALGWWLIGNTKFGKAIRAISDDPIAARIVGINSEKIILIAFAIGSGLAGAAGILVSFETDITPTMGFTAILKGITVSVIGGMGNIPGSLFGGLLLGLAENLGVWRIDAGWKDAIGFAVLVAFLLFRPSGIAGVESDKEQP